MSPTKGKKDSRSGEPSARARKLLRSLPSVSTLLEQQEVQDWLSGLPRGAVVGALQASLDAARRVILSGQRREGVDEEEVLAGAELELTRRSMPSLRRVINATGIVLHTGLGRAPLSEAAIESIVECASGYSNLEYDLATGRRGRRQSHVIELLSTLTGAEAATVVNNNAAATLLILQTFAAGKEVVVSRGQLVEIGGSFRLPDIMAAGGATLHEVGTTNRTHLSDYQSAIGDDTAMLLRVHPSNFRVVGFTKDVPIGEMAQLAHRFNLIAVDDLGSGALLNLAEWGLPEEPLVRGSIEGGADLCCFSGDKLLGGPQCGLIVGRQSLIEQLEANPLMRTYRVGKLTLAALEATLRAYADREEALASVPTLAMLTCSTEELAARAQKLCEQLKAALPGEQFFVCSDVGFAGGGAMPGREVPTVVVQWRPSATSTPVMVEALRDAEVPVIARVRDDAICLDVRTIRDEECDDLVSSLAAAAVEALDDVDSGLGEISLPVL